jgi:hypothetical protein
MTWGYDGEGRKRRGFFSVKDVTPQRGDRISRSRRAWYSFASTVFCLIVPVTFVYLGLESTLAQKVFSASPS